MNEDEEHRHGQPPARCLQDDTSGEKSIFENSEEMSLQQVMFQQQDGGEESVDIESVMALSDDSKGSSKWVHADLCTQKTSISVPSMSLESNMLSGVHSVESSMSESFAMLSLGTTVTAAQSKPQNECDKKTPPWCLIHEGSTTNVYQLYDPGNRYGGKTKNVAVK
eukprot:6792232-Ditylum_brightwellii.AAC.1